MLKTIAILLVTVVIVPVTAYYFDAPLDLVQKSGLRDMAFIMLGVAVICFLLGEFTGNNSQVDKIWSILPIMYVWHFARLSDFNPRLILMAILVTIWGVRLTYNFSRKGAYSLKFWEGEEDYRWPVLRTMPIFNKKWKWSLFNLGFICLYQNMLILLFTLPALVSMADSGKKLGVFELILTIAFLIAIWIESKADQQQFDFQREKYRLLASGVIRLPVKYHKGFVSDGLWAKVRHPNYAAEQAIWVIFYFFSVAATGQWINWSIVGCLLLLLLFQGSSDFSEKISSDKYPEYKDYQNLVPRFLPKLLK